MDPVTQATNAGPATTSSDYRERGHGPPYAARFSITDTVSASGNVCQSVPIGESGHHVTSIAPVTQVKLGICGRGTYVGSPSVGGGGPGCFPLAPGFVSFRCRAVGSRHLAKSGYNCIQFVPHRVHRYDHHELKEKPYHVRYTLAGVPDHFSQQRPDFIDRHPLSSHQILLVLLRGRDLGCNVHILRISSNARFQPP